MSFLPGTLCFAIDRAFVYRSPNLSDVVSYGEVKINEVVLVINVIDKEDSNTMSTYAYVMARGMLGYINEDVLRDACSQSNSLIFSRITST